MSSEREKDEQRFNELDEKRRWLRTELDSVIDEMIQLMWKWHNKGKGEPNK